MNINIRLMQDSELHLVNEVYNSAYGNIRPDDFFRWEFYSAPWGKAIYVIAEDLDKSNNKIIGTQCAIPMMLVNGAGEKILSAKSEDTYVHPEYRGHKLFDRMYELLFLECRKAGIKYIWGFTYARKPFEKIGFEIPFDAIQAVEVAKPINAFRFISALNSKNAIKEKIKILALSFYGYLNHMFKVSGSDDFQNVNKNNKLRGDVDLFKQLLKSKRNLWSIEENTKYIDWRFNLNPYKNKYAEITLSDTSGDFARIIIKNPSDGLIFIEEILLNEDISNEKKILALKKLIRFLRKEYNYSLLRYWGFETNERNKLEIDLLKKCGFVFIKKGISFVWKSLDDGNNSLNPKELFLSRVYTQGNS